MRIKSLCLMPTRIVILSLLIFWTSWHVADASHGQKYHSDGSKFREIRKMTNNEYATHRESLTSFINDPKLRMPNNMDFVNRKASHFAKIVDEQGRECVLNYTVEHSEFHQFFVLEKANILNITDVNNGTALALTFHSIKDAVKAVNEFRKILHETKELIMLTGTAAWGIRRSFTGILHN